MDPDLLTYKNTTGNYQCVRQHWPSFQDERYCTLLPIDIEVWIDQQKKLGYEVGIFDITKKITIYKSENYKGHEDYKNVATSRTEEGK